MGIDAGGGLDLGHQGLGKGHVVDVRNTTRPYVPAGAGGALHAVWKRHDHALGIGLGGVR